MPQDKKKTKQPSKPQKGGLGSANNFFETAEELANRHPESQERSQGKMQKRNQTAQNPEKPEQ